MSDKSSSGTSAPEPAAVVRTALVVTAILVIALLLWQLSDVLLLGFAAVLVAIILRSIARLLEKHTPLGEPWSLVLSTLFTGGAVAGFVVLLGAQIAAQLATVVEGFPEMVTSLGDRLGIDNLSERLAERMEDLSRRSGLVGRIAGYTSLFVATIANVLLVVVAGIYLASRPERYRRFTYAILWARKRKCRASPAEVPLWTWRENCLK